MVCRTAQARVTVARRHLFGRVSGSSVREVRTVVGERHPARSRGRGRLPDLRRPAAADGADRRRQGGRLERRRLAAPARAPGSHMISASPNRTSRPPTDCGPSSTGSCRATRSSTARAADCWGTASPARLRCCCSTTWGRGAAASAPRRSRTCATERTSSSSPRRAATRATPPGTTTCAPTRTRRSKSAPSVAPSTPGWRAPTSGRGCGRQVVEKLYGGYRDYQERTDREIPLVILEPR